MGGEPKPMEEANPSSSASSSRFLPLLFASFDHVRTLAGTLRSAAVFPTRPPQRDEGGRPASGLSNQVAELRNALRMAAVLNQTLIVPPVLDHHGVTLGSCPKFRVTNQQISGHGLGSHQGAPPRSGIYQLGTLLIYQKPPRFSQNKKSYQG